MSSKMNTKIRLVRCPRCRKVLPELPDVAVYRCGSCGAALQAKNWKNATTEDVAPKDDESDPSLKLKQAASEEASSSNQQTCLVSTEEIDQNASTVCANPPDEPRSSTELSSHENAESSPEAGAHLGSDNSRDKNGFVDSDGPNCQEKKPLPEEVDLERENDSFQNEHGDSSPENKLSEKVVSDRENSSYQHEFGDSSGEFPDCLLENSSSSELIYQEPVKNTEMSEEDSKRSSSSTFKSLIAAKLLDTRPRGKSTLTEEDILSDPNENQHMIQDFVPVNTMDTLEDVPFFKDQSNGVTLQDIARSSTHRMYYGYEGSVSSFDGNDDQVPGLHLLRKERNFGGNMSKGFPKRDKNVKSSGLGKGYHAKNASKDKDPESEKIKLLRMVRELQDQLNRTTLNLKEQEKQTLPSYYDRRVSEREMYHIPNYPRYAGRYGEGKIWSQPQQMAFSSETGLSRSRVECPCFHCCPQERHFSAQFPPHVICINNPTRHPSRLFYNNPYQSGPSSPQHHSGSDFSIWSRESNSDEQRHGKDRLRAREKNHSSRRHFRPIAGGAPLVACYHCEQVLQLPADFLLFSRRPYHRLRCSACSQVLKFSLENRTRIVRYSPKEALTPPSSEVGDYSAHNILASGSRASYIDDYGRSSGKSYSTATEPSTLDQNRNDAMTSSRSSSEPVMDDKKKTILQEFQNRHGDFAGTRDFSRPPSSKMPERVTASSEIEEIQPAGSPLHRLMGYSSPSKVMRG